MGKLLCGEWIVSSSNGTTDDVIPLIREQEIALSTLKDYGTFIIKKIGIKVDSDCVLLINGNREFNLKADEVLEFGYGMFDIYSLKVDRSGVGMVIRYGW